MAQKEKRILDKESENLLNQIDEIASGSKKKKKENKKEEKKDNKTKKEKKTPANKESWLKGVKSEFKKVRWPSKKEMVKYSIATISFIIFFGLFFFAIEGIIYLLKTL